MKVAYVVHFIVHTYLYYILFYVYYILKKKKVFKWFCFALIWMVVLQSSEFVTWSVPTKVCGVIGYEVTFLPLKAFISYINLRCFGLFVLGLPLKNGMEIPCYL